MSEYVPDERAKWAWDIIKNRRAVRDFDLTRPISDDVIYRVLEAGTWAPSPENWQPWRYILITDPAIKQFIGEKTVRACIRDFGVAMPRRIVEEHYSYFRRKRISEYVVDIMATGQRMEYAKKAPMQVAIVFDAECTNFEDYPTVVGMFAGMQSINMGLICAGNTLVNMWNMASAMGFGAVFTDFAITHQDDEAEIARVLNIPYPRWRIAGFFCMGWPAFPRTVGPPRYPVEALTFENQWGNFWEPKKKPTW